MHMAVKVIRSLTPITVALFWPISIIVLAYMFRSSIRDYLFGSAKPHTIHTFLKIVHGMAPILVALFWPLVVLILAFMFRSAIRNLISRILTVEGPGFKFGLVPGDDERSQKAAEKAIAAQPASTVTTPTTIERVAEPSLTQPSKIALDQMRQAIDTDKPANIYWLAQDLTNLFDAILRGADRGFVIWQIGQADHHFKEIRLSDPALAARLTRIVSKAQSSTTSDWDKPEYRLNFAQEVRGLAMDIGNTINGLQPGFKP